MSDKKKAERNLITLIGLFEKSAADGCRLISVSGDQVEWGKWGKLRAIVDNVLFDLGCRDRLQGVLDGLRKEGSE